MKILKRIVYSILIIALITILFKGVIFRSFVYYKAISEKTNYTINQNNLKNEIEDLINTQNEFKINSLINESLKFTSNKLSFTFTKNENNPNVIFKTTTANCVGYATFFSATFNYIVSKYNLSNTWRALPQKGQLYLFNINVHSYLNSPFFKDHDFVIVSNLQTGEQFAIDPTVHDYFGIDYVSLKK
jgi:uncharacterized protein YxeA